MTDPLLQRAVCQFYATHFTQLSHVRAPTGVSISGRFSSKSARNTNKTHFTYGFIYTENVSVGRHIFSFFYLTLLSIESDILREVHYDDEVDVSATCA